MEINLDRIKKSSKCTRKQSSCKNALLYVISLTPNFYSYLFFFILNLIKQSVVVPTECPNFERFYFSNPSRMFHKWLPKHILLTKFCLLHLFHQLYEKKSYIFTFYFRPKRTLHSKKYGADLVRFAHGENFAVHSSTKIDGKEISASLNCNDML